MPHPFIQLKFIKYKYGHDHLYSHLDAQHAMPPEADLFTAQIVEQVIEKTGCFGIISQISRTIADLNRKPNGRNNEALEEYRKTIKSNLLQLGILNQETNTSLHPYLHLTIHGMRDLHHGPYAIEIGTQNGRSCSPDVLQWFQHTITTLVQKVLPNITIIFDHFFNGDESILYHRLGDGDTFKGYGPHFHTFQIEISRTLRENHLPEIVELLSKIMLSFQQEIVMNDLK
ncbi:hypothetical protein ACE38V_02015 [Cytobacillus sp. Hz8]|uniref:hypothetical protein n=1 Tax=Cytobacillus sp. Hz8 TaxID=3347168 RepID=UPI0035E03DB4